MPAPPSPPMTNEQVRTTGRDRQQQVVRRNVDRDTLGHAINDSDALDLRLMERTSARKIA